MMKTNELNINDYIKLAEEKIGYVGELRFQSKNNEYAGKFEILGFEPNENPQFTYSHWSYEEDDTPDGARLGYFTIKLTDTKFYNNKIMKFKVNAYVQSREGRDNRLFISTKNEVTGKYLKAYEFPILNW